MAASQEPRELVLDISNTLSGPWSASSVAGMLTQESVSYLARREKWDAMEPLIRAKLVLSPLFLRKGDLDAMHDSLMEIQSVARQDRNEWVHMLSSAVDGYDGRVHTDKVLEEMPQVRETVDAVVDLAADIDPSIYRPLEEKYLSDRVLDQLGCLGFSMARQGDCRKPAIHSHFTVRDSIVDQKVQQSVPSVSDSVKLPLGGGSNGFSQPMKQRKTPAEIQKAGLGQKAGIQASASSLFMRPSREKVVGRVGGGNRAAQVKKKAAILDISAIQQARAINEQRRQDLKKQKEEEKEIESKEKAEALEAEKKAKEERKQILKEQEKRAKDLMKQKAKEEKKKALDEAKALKDEERKKKREMNNQSAGSSKKHKAANAPLDPQDVTAALGKARLKADLESTKDIENHKAFQNA